MQNTTKDYWEERVRTSTDDKDLLFRDGRRDEYWRRVRETLNQWKDLRVLDVCCGFGQFADIFTIYNGIDFSEEMIKKARARLPKYSFAQHDAYDPPEGKWDVVFEVNSLHSMGMTPEEFYEKYKGHAKVAVACLEADEFRIFQIYDR